MTLKKLWILLLFAALFAADLFFCFKRNKRALGVLLAVTAAGTLCALSFYLRLEVKTEPAFALCGKTAAVCGRVTETAPTENGAAFVLENCEINGRQTGLSVTVYASSPPEAALWDTARFTSVRFAAAPRKTVFLYHTLSEGRVLTGFARGGEVAASYRGGSPRYRIALLRRDAQARIFSALPEPDAGIASALLLGTSDTLPDSFRSALRTAGASHIFAVSGMHLSVWCGVIFLVLQRRARTKLWANAGVIGFLLFFVFFTGFSVSVLRAGLMLFTVLCGRLLKKPADGLNSLGFSVCVLLLANPFLAGNVSFLLSALATTAILLLFPLFRVNGGPKRSAAAVLRAPGEASANGAVLSLCALLFTLPVSGAFFGGISLLAPVSSFFCALPAEGAMLSAAGGLCLRFWPAASDLCFRGSAVCCGAIRTLTDRLQALDFLYVGVRNDLVVIWYVGTPIAAAAAYLLSKRNFKNAVNALLFSAALLLTACGALRLAETGKTTLHLTANGNAAAVCLETGGSAILIGAGGDYEAAQRTETALLNAGIVRLDALIVPSDAETESGQLSFFAGRFRARRLFTAAPLSKFAPDAELCRTAPCFSLRLPGGETYRNLNFGGLCAGLLEGETKVVFSFSPANDFSACPALQSGDCLICRAGLPKGIDPAAFGRIFVLTDKSAAALSLPPNAVSLADAGNVDLILRR